MRDGRGWVLFWVALTLVVGLVFLVGGAEILVRGAVGVARRANVAPTLVGLTLVAFGTSLPELTATLEAALRGSAGIAIGNVLGSNICNVLLVLGAAAVVRPLLVDRAAFGRDFVAMMGASLVLVPILWSHGVGRGEGVLLAALMAAYLAYTYIRRDRHRGSPEAQVLAHEVEEIQAVPTSPWVLALAVVGGLAGVIFGARLFITGAVEVARNLGVDESIIGLTLVAVGTSLPELATSLVAVARRHGDVAVANAVGSNIFNVLGILGITSIVSPLAVPHALAQVDIWIMLASGALLLPFLAWRLPLGRAAGLLFVAAYAAYVAGRFGAFA